jgi:hypothetical protein
LQKKWTQIQKAKNPQEEDQTLITFTDIEWKEDHTNLLKQLLEMYNFRFDEV